MAWGGHPDFNPVGASSTLAPCSETPKAPPSHARGVIHNDAKAAESAPAARGMPNVTKTRTLAAAIASDDVWEGDVLLFRGAGPIAWMIQKAGGTPYSHAAMVGWKASGDEYVPYCLETREWIGSRAVTLKSQVERNLGRIDVYRVIAPLRPESMTPATKYMWATTGREYGWTAVFNASLRHLPLWRWLVEPDTNDDALDDMPPFCSQLVDQALRQVDLDPCPNRAGRITEPGDLSRSAILQYRYTLGGL